MLSSSQDVLVKLSETTSPQKLFPSDCITLYNSEFLYIFESVTRPVPMVLRSKFNRVSELYPNIFWGTLYLASKFKSVQGSTKKFCCFLLSRRFFGKYLLEKRAFNIPHEQVPYSKISLRFFSFLFWQKTKYGYIYHLDVDPAYYLWTLLRCYLELFPSVYKWTSSVKRCSHAKQKSI